MRVAVLASGSGTILQAMVDAGLSIDLLVVDRRCKATAVAQHAGIEAKVLERSTFGEAFDRVGYTRALTDMLVAHDIDLVAMAGFGTILEQPIYDHYAGRVLNTHPALLPSFPGWHGVRDALDYGVKVTGCTVHVATLEVDNGPIRAQEAIVVLPDDTEATLHERIKVVVRRLYVGTIKSIIERGHVLESVTASTEEQRR